MSRLGSSPSRYSNWAHTWLAMSSLTSEPSITTRFLSSRLNTSLRGSNEPSSAVGMEAVMPAGYPRAASVPGSPRRGHRARRRTACLAPLSANGARHRGAPTDSRPPTSGAKHLSGRLRDVAGECGGGVDRDEHAGAQRLQIDAFGALLAGLVAGVDAVHDAGRLPRVEGA